MADGAFAVWIILLTIPAISVIKYARTLKVDKGKIEIESRLEM